MKRFMPLKDVYGDLRQYNADGATLWVHPPGTRGMLKFIPAHTIVEVESLGENPR